MSALDSEESLVAAIKGLFFVAPGALDLKDDAALLPLHWQHLSWAARNNVKIGAVVNVIDMPYLGDLVIE